MPMPGAPRIRMRQMSWYESTSISRVYWPHGYGHSGELASETSGRLTAEGREIMVDSLHPWPPRKKKQDKLGFSAAFKTDVGGDLTHTKTHWIDPGSEVNLEIPEVGLTGRRTYSGYWWPVSPWTLSPIAIPSESEANYWGAKGIALASPTRPQAGMAQFLGELKDLPKFPILSLYRALKAGGNPRKLIRNSGSEYLNIEFGWRPLVKDMIDFHEARKNADKIISQYLRDSGKTVKRRRKLKDEKDTWVTTGNSNSIGIGPSGNFLSPIAKTVTEVNSSEKIWIHASFTYYISAGGTFRSQLKREEQLLAKLYGTRFGIDTLYELTPWSWALDWVGNLGDVARNLAAFSNDDLVLHYAYVMFEREEIRTTELTAIDRGTGQPVRTVARARRWMKRRVRATPFGFGINMAALSSRQLAIIAALGMSRV